ncbi:DUF3006 domain-containing protein [Cohnella luojiensis]|uniref:DUF3006 domain-containing protein n=1 Tax=Cohnella luojiensis TaxID=652876 RepID=A0A4Y8MBD6_9BACL|nr:DUF3006 domain-containing protein [Cohnella luojiensis]TFE31777.1 DUF3006 domain-containing protein [Cohnella luojiensis]
MEHGVVDRFEGDMAVIEIEGATRDFPRASLPLDIKIGDSVIIENGEVRRDNSQSARRRTEVKRLMNELFE